MSIYKLKKSQIIALTGGIASGKSYACNVFKKNNFKIIDLDDISSIIYKQKNTCQELINIFKTCDKNELKKIVFNDKIKLQQLENYLHPKILTMMQDKIKIAKYSITTGVIIAIPLLFEKALYKYFDSAIVIVTTKELQIKRMVARDGIDKNLAEKILQTQATNKQRKEISKYLPTTFIENTTTIIEFEHILKSFKQLKICNKYMIV